MDKGLTLYTVVIPGTFNDGFDYLAKSGFEGEIGIRVMVPFRNQKKLGFIIQIHQNWQKGIRYKAIEKAIDKKAIIHQAKIQFLSFLASYYHSPLSEVFKLAFPKAIRKGNALSYPLASFIALEKNQPEIVLTGKKQISLLERLQKEPIAINRDILTKEGFSKAQISALLEKGFIKEKETEQSFNSYLKGEEKVVHLNSSQQKAVDEIALAINKFKVFLIDGVTGSGKTEVYLALAKKVLDNNKQVLILIPEIGLTPHFKKRIEERLLVKTLLLHSALSEKEKLFVFTAAFKGDAKVIIGTRSALFLPLLNLGLIVVDEEHDLSFKQHDSVRYSARDMAVFWGKIINAPVVLGSATPSLESLNNVNANKYQKIVLRQKALAKNPLYFKIVDIRNKRLQAGLSDDVMRQIKTHIEKKEQVLIFLNRRGYAPVYLCHQCGKAKGCPNCSTNLVYHQMMNKVSCHQCGYYERPKNVCPHCQANGMISVGVGTEQVSQFLSETFDEYKTLRIDRDSIKNEADFNQVLKAIDDGQADILVGTQMLAKGHHFKRLSLVVLLDLDLSFASPDFRAIERFSQLVTQVSGRAGREDLQGYVYLQTHMPQHPLLLTLVKSGYETLAKTLLEERKVAMLPPFSQQVLVKTLHKNSDRAQNCLAFLADKLREKHQDILLLGPAPSAIEKRKGYYQWHFALLSVSRKKLNLVLADLDANYQNEKKRFPGVLLFIDVDPLQQD